ncbi:NAD-dependent epimerase/dehydratase family protein [Rubellicoccus peritrichatus]|uniref:NAD-dependent epimerase/dehydratase family protein n=1 Tax=Rubellicoccus peritrichatus TaxID=3080537 RepID=A0AAQ3LAN4_9BACT|nr:NAD-dependent epimerase/dehydratase family protein [Puniceicoccus sp. CR14]WOO40717.1 NAD-dependent epimerase/dehydratase family protein [Puniceicoccus sp. CR14]
MKILITGGSGFIGSHLVEHYQGVAEEIRVLDNLRTGYRNNLEGFDCTFVEGSITDRGVVKEAVKDIDIIYHLAALVSVPESMSSPLECVEINVNGLLNVLEEGSKTGAKKLVFASSAAIYGDNPTIPKVESMFPEPRSPYAITKLDGEYYCDLYQRENRISTAAIRFFNVFGPRQDPNGAYAAAVPIFIERAVNNQEITIFGEGDQTRDFIYVKDIVNALTFAGENEKIHGVHNAGYGAQITIRELADEIISATSSSSKIKHAPTRAGDVKHSRASAELLLSKGWQPKYSLASGLKETLEHLSII